MIPQTHVDVEGSDEETQVGTERWPSDGEPLTSRADHRHLEGCGNSMVETGTKMSQNGAVHQ